MPNQKIIIELLKHQFKTMIVVTHDGRFHADEVAAISIIQTINMKNENFELNIVRTRDISIINKADIVIDVGKIYDPLKLRFDHHQDSCMETFPNCDIPLSSAGLVYRHFGKKLIKSYKADITNEDLEIIYVTFYHAFIKEIDAVDNGVSHKFDVQNRYRPTSTLSCLVSRLVPNIDDAELYQNAFNRACKLARNMIDIILSDCIEKHILTKSDYEIVKKAFNNPLNKEWDRFNRILYIPNECKTWENCVKTYEREYNVEQVIYVIYENGGSFRIRAIQDKEFTCRKKLLPYDQYENEIKKDLEFIHKNLFIGSSKSFDCLLSVAKTSLMA